MYLGLLSFQAVFSMSTANCYSLIITATHCIIIINLPQSQINRLQNIRNSLAPVSKSSHITSVLKPLHWLKINEHIEYKLLSLLLNTHHLICTLYPEKKTKMFFVISPIKLR